MPPPGGFEAVKYKRNLPLKGPGALVILGGVTAICTYGFFRLGKGNLEKRWVRYCYRERGDNQVTWTWNVSSHAPLVTKRVLGSEPLVDVLISHFISVRTRKGKLS
jgi:hypothetical protein